MDKQSLSEAISKATKYAKNLKQQVSISNPQPLSENEISSELNYSQIAYLTKNSLPFNKAQSKIESKAFFRYSSPPKIVDKSMLNTTFKLPINKKEIQSQNERQKAFNKSQNRIQNKQLSSLLTSSIGSRELVNKKGGHNHTYTHLNDLNLGKVSQNERKMSTKDEKINRIRHSKSPSIQRHNDLNYTTYAQEAYNSKYLNHFHLPQRSKSQQKENLFQASKLLKEINRLQQIIKKYKSLIMQIKTKYKETQQKLQQKVINDHFMDVLKLQIEQLQDKNNSLNLVVFEQSQLINNFECILVDKVIKINQYYNSHIEDMIKTQKQNEILKKMLLLATQKPKIDSFVPSASSKERDSLLGNSAFENISRNIDKFTQKWS